MALDLSDALGTPYPATGPSLLARFLCIAEGDAVDLAPNATSALFYCLRGPGYTEVRGPGGLGHDHVAGRGRRHLAGERPAPGTAPSRVRVLYHVDDSPLLAYLGVEATEAPIRAHPLRRRARPGPAGRGGRRPRRGPAQPGGGAPRQRPQRPDPDGHAHAVGHARRPARRARCSDPTVTRASPWTSSWTASPGCYTLVGAEIRPDGTIVDPVRVDWEPGGAFVTPPGLWHSHHNESGAPANLLPVQDAGLHTYLRTLDIRFTGP